MNDADSMRPILRAALIGVYIALPGALLVAAIHPAYHEWIRYTGWWIEWTATREGIIYAQFVLLAIWVTLGQLRIGGRAVICMAGSIALLYLAPLYIPDGTYYSSRLSSDAMVMLFLFLWALVWLGICRWCGFQVKSVDRTGISKALAVTPASFRFTIRQLIVVTGVMGVVFGFIRFRTLNEARYCDLDNPLFIALRFLYLFGRLSIFVGFALVILWAVLGSHSRRLRAATFTVFCIAVGVAVCWNNIELVDTGMYGSYFQQVVLSGRIFTFKSDYSTHRIFFWLAAGLIMAFTFMTVRLCGYRLVRFPRRSSVVLSSAPQRTD